MGIRGLIKYCFENNCTEKRDLVVEASEGEGIEILVDLNSFKYYLLEGFWKSLNGNLYLRICGAEYASLEAYISRFIRDLQSLGIKLVFFLDGCRGSCPDTTVNKRDTLTRYRKNDIERKMKILDVCTGTKHFCTLGSVEPTIPALFDAEMFSIIKQCECELVQCVSGEADPVIAKELQERKAFAILSNDADFCIFRESKVIPIRGFWPINEEMRGPMELKHLYCEMIKSDKLRERLKFDDVDQLVEMSIIVGNDFTRPILEELDQDVNSQRRFKEAAELIREYRTLDKHPRLAKTITDNERFKKAVEHSRKFYKLELTDGVDSSGKDETTLIIEEGIRSGQLSGIVKGLNNRFFWRPVLLEDFSQSVHEALAPLRSYIYKMVLPTDNNCVTEYDSTCEEVIEFEVKAADDSEVPRIQDKERTAENKKTFHHIMTCMDRALGCFSDSNETWFDRYETKTAFKCYLLRFFFVLNREKNLGITRSEFSALVAVVLGNEDETSFHQIRLCPDVRCLTISTWFQEIYYHAYTLLGKILYLSEEFPLPHETFSGSVWTTFYYCSDDQASNTDPLMDEKREKMQQIISEQSEIIEQLME